MKRVLLILFAAILACPILPAQEKSGQVDSLVSLLSAQSMQQMEIRGVTYRKVIGPARFLHNNTFLICDTALWNVGRNVIDAYGNVRILQEQTVLTGDSLHYIIDNDLAQFRGQVVQLQDKDKNTLRTRHLDYNTKDSVAVFRNGGSFRSQDGQVIESRNGTYDSKISTFTFSEMVNMFTDSVWVKTTRLVYRTDIDHATFGYATDAWRDNGMLSANAGWYDRPRDLFLFYRDVHGMDPEKEVWADSLYLDRLHSNLDMRGKVQLKDTVNKISAFCGQAVYTDSTSRLVLTRDPSAIAVTDSTGTRKDTVWVAAEYFDYRSRFKGDLPPYELKASEQRLSDIATDAVTAFRKKAAEEARKAAEEAAKKDPNRPPDIKAPASKDALKDKNSPSGKDIGAPPAKKDKAPSGATPPDAGKDRQPSDSLKGDAPLLPPSDTVKTPGDSLGVPKGGLSIPKDSLGVLEPSDTLSAGAGITAPTDSLSAGEGITSPTDSSDVSQPIDSTRIGFLKALRRVRLFREDIQIVADSLEYTDLDSLVRLYRDPIIWNEVTQQFRSDSIFAVVKNQSMEKASLMSNAFVIIEEAPNCYDQIRSTEMLAYFDGQGGLRRFDALGEANAIFYMKEDSTFATVNMSEAKMLYALFSEGTIEDVYYFESAKTNAYPLAQLSSEDRVLKGFEWQPDKRPASPQDVTTAKVPKSQRLSYSRHTRPAFTQTDIYFPGYIAGIRKEIREREIAKRNRPRTKPAEQTPMDTSSLGGLLSPSDSLSAQGDRESVVKDSLGKLPPRDSLSVPAKDSLSGAKDSLKVGTDTLSSGAGVPKTVTPTKKELREKEKAAQKAMKAARKKALQEERERKWARQDSLDAVKDSLKLEKKLQKERQRKLKALEKQRKQQIKDAEKLEYYRKIYEKKHQKELQKEREKARARREKEEREKAQKASREAGGGIPTEGNLPEEGKDNPVIEVSPGSEASGGGALPVSEEKISKEEETVPHEPLFA